MDEWDPMATAFQDKKYNSYNEGVGRDLLDSNSKASGAKLFVANIPKNLGNEGLFNLFAEYGTVVESAVIPSEKSTTIGFVTMRSAVEGEMAISKLDNKKLGSSYLRVKVALTKEEKERRKQDRQKEDELMGSLKKDFRWDNDSASVKSENSSGSQKDGSVMSFRSERAVLEEKGRGAGQQASLNIPEIARLRGMKFCTRCLKEGCTYFCSRCKLYYCSVECQKLDWPNHRDLCLAFSEYFKMKANKEKETKVIEKIDTEKGEQRIAKECRDYKASPSKLKKNSSSSEQSTGKPKQSDELEHHGVNSMKGSTPEVADSGADAGASGDATYGQVQMTIPVGSSGMAYLTYYESPYQFWISLADHLEEFTETTLLMAEQASCKPPSNPKPRDTFGVFWEGEWARVEVIQVNGIEITVFFMDYGNTGVVQKGDLRPLTLDIIKLPAQALCCCVSKIKPKGSGWSEKAVDAVRVWFGLPMTKNFSFEVVDRKGTKNAVKISINNEALAEVLLNGNFAERDSGEPGLPSITSGPAQKHSSRFMVKDLKSEMKMVKVGEGLMTALVEFLSPVKFTVLKKSSQEVLQDLQALMAAEFSVSDGKDPYRPVVGEVVAAKYSADNQWYRSQVLKVEKDTCSLFFVDYGNSENQSFQNVREIKSQKIKDIPSQALVCCLKELEGFPSSILEHVSQELPNFQVDRAWTLLSVKEVTEDQLAVDIVSTKDLSLSERVKQAYQAKTNLLTTPHKSQQTKSKATVAKSPSPAKKKELLKALFELKEEKLPIDPVKMITVTIPYVLDCGEFYVCKATNEKRFKAMMDELNKSVHKRPFYQEPPAVGTVAAVQYSADKIWYRGRILEVEQGGDDRCRVIFVDYGNVEVVPWAKLKELEEHMCNLPAQAIRCRLAGNVEVLSAASHQEFKQYLESETVDIKVMEGDGHAVAVQIFAKGADVNAIFFDSKEQEGKKISSLVLEKGTPIQVECVNLASPSAFYVQISSQSEASVKATLSLKSRLEKKPQPVDSVVPGDFVASRFSQDEEVIWYRGRVEKVANNKATIFFVDYGNFEERTISELMVLSEEDCSLPAATMKCQLRSCVKSTPDMDATFAKNGQRQIDSIRVISQNEKGCVVDVLDCGGKCITEMFTQLQVPCPVPVESSSRMSQDDYAMKSKVSLSHNKAAASPVKTVLPSQTVLDPNSFIPVTVTHIDSCSSFYVTCLEESLQTQLLELMVALNQTAESLPVVSKPRPGIICAACFSQDGSWYRARIMSLISDTTCKVQFVDYGNSEETSISGLRELNKNDPTFFTLPAQAINCCLLGFERDLTAGSIDQMGSGGAVVDQLKRELLEKPLTMKMNKEVGDRLVVEIKDEQDQPIHMKFMKCTRATEDIPMLSDLVFEETPDKEFAAFFLQLSNLDCFYCHRWNEEEITELMTMAELLEADVSHLPPDSTCTPVVGGLYSSHFQGVWYRCVVEKIQGSQVLIKYIDYGNSEEKPANELRPLNKRRLSLPVRLIKCKLHGLTPVYPGWEHSDIPHYLTMLSEKQPHLKVHGEDECGTKLVSMTIGEGSAAVDVAQDLISIGQAIATKEEDAPTMGAHAVAQSEEADAEDVEEADMGADEIALAKQIEELQRLQRQLLLKKELKKGKSSKN